MSYHVERSRGIEYVASCCLRRDAQRNRETSGSCWSAESQRKLGGRLTFFGPILLLTNFSALVKIRESEKEEHYAYVLINISQYFSIS